MLFTRLGDDFKLHWCSLRGTKLTHFEFWSSLVFNIGWSQLPSPGLGWVAGPLYFCVNYQSVSSCHLQNLNLCEKCHSAYKGNFIHLDIYWKDWCWSWSPNSLATWCEELTHWKRPWFWERLRAGGEDDGRGLDGWMASPIWGTWVWASSWSWWWTGKPGVLQSMGSQRVGHDWVTELKRINSLWRITYLISFVESVVGPLLTFISGFWENKF